MHTEQLLGTKTGQRCVHALKRMQPIHPPKKVLRGKGFIPKCRSHSSPCSSCPQNAEAEGCTPTGETDIASSAEQPGQPSTGRGRSKLRSRAGSSRISFLFCREPQRTTQEARERWGCGRARQRIKVNPSLSTQHARCCNSRSKQPRALAEQLLKRDDLT